MTFQDPRFPQIKFCYVISLLDSLLSFETSIHVDTGVATDFRASHRGHKYKSILSQTIILTQAMVTMYSTLVYKIRVLFALSDARGAAWQQQELLHESRYHFRYSAQRLKP